MCLLIVLESTLFSKGLKLLIYKLELQLFRKCEIDILWSENLGSMTSMILLLSTNTSNKFSI